MNKKKTGILFLLILLLLLAGIGVVLHNNNSKEKEVGEKDYKEYSFMDIQWMRETEADTEYIRFSSDGSFHYYCACGNPVNDSDLCESYTYDAETKTIRLNCFATTDSMVTTIVIKDCGANHIELDFDGELRKFTKEKN